MDPVSATASVVTLLSVTSGTIKVVYNLLIAFVDAPHEIMMQIRSLESFCTTINSLRNAYERIPDEFALKVDLGGIEELVEEAKSLTTKLNTQTVRITSGHIGRARESCKWMLFDRQSRKFFKSLGRWDIILSQALWAAQM
jgi:hypothetical protein